MNKFTIYCSQEQTKRAYELGAPIEKSLGISHGVKTTSITPEHEGSFYGVIPTVEQMKGWLEEQHQIYLHIAPTTNGIDTNWLYTMLFDFGHDEEIWHVDDSHVYESRKDAMMDAIDEALKYLEKKGE